ncbi:MAG: gliding motility-associated C-terminal domain-containing protein [Flavobacteriales bacterium]|nr:gliding motility-associated C-terminal domain-containing protein [Flavobacteriales bacterium]
MLFFSIRSISQNCGYTIQESTTPVSCNGMCDGSFSITVTGGTSPYSYLWNNGESASSISNICSGGYSIIITDNAGCDSTYTTQEIAIPDPLLINASKIDIICENLGQVTANSTGGVKPYKYLFTGYTDSLNNPVFSDLAAGSYTLTLADKAGCYTETIIDIVELTCLEPVAAEAFSPNGDGINESWHISNLNLHPNYRIYVYDRWGQKIFDSEVNTIPWNGEGVFGSVPAASYYYVIIFDTTDDDSKIIKGSVSVAK